MRLSWVEPSLLAIIDPSYRLNSPATDRQETHLSSKKFLKFSTLDAQIRRLVRKARRVSVNLGIPPRVVGFRELRVTTVPEHVARMAAQGRRPSSLEVVHQAATGDAPLPYNVSNRLDLPAETGWWGYSMRDVPKRACSATLIATIPEARVLSYLDERNEFRPAVVTRDQRALNLREISYRYGHRDLLLNPRETRKIARATWICERVYDNHSHWLTAHLPKLCLLKERDALADVLLPEKISPVMDSSMRMLGLDPTKFATFKPGEILEVNELTILQTDRFRRELLDPVRRMIAPASGKPASRRVYISRKKAGMRMLLNEDEIWPLFAAAGFERVCMEALDFAAQVKLMSETKVLAAPHGAGLTNMMFCPPGARILEIAWLGFPNPNFYALASAMGHAYGIVSAEAVESPRHPLQRDMRVKSERVSEGLSALERSLASETVEPGR